MKTLTRHAGQSLLTLVFSLALLAVSSVARADTISFQLSPATLMTTSNGTAVFLGSLTNNSGSDLMATDFFFNFFGYDFNFVTPLQDLGASDFSIPNGTTSASVDLFSITLNGALQGSSFPVQVQLEDANGDVSGTQTATVTVPGSTPTGTPEPSSMTLLFISALAGLGVVRRKKKASTN
jgi:hypothetical protein